MRRLTSWCHTRRYTWCDSHDGTSIVWEVAAACGLLVLLGAGSYLAFETRNVPAGFNESRYCSHCTLIAVPLWLRLVPHQAPGCPTQPSDGSYCPFSTPWWCFLWAAHCSMCCVRYVVAVMTVCTIKVVCMAVGVAVLSGCVRAYFFPPRGSF